MLVSSSRRSTAASRAIFSSPLNIFPALDAAAAEADADVLRTKRLPTRHVMAAFQGRKQQQPQGKQRRNFHLLAELACAIPARHLTAHSRLAGNALIELGRQAQQLRRSHNEIRMEAVESRLMKLHLAIVITSVVNLISVIIEQEISWRRWYGMRHTTPSCAAPGPACIHTNPALQVLV